ncbi:MAG: hypothetical protein ACYSSI_14385, partial [Planctomycetota bacterium]
MAFETGFDRLHWPWQKSTTKHFTKKVKQAAEDYLNKKSIKLEQLTEQQQVCVFEYLSCKRNCILGLLPLALTVFMSVNFIFFYIQSTERVIINEAPKKMAVVLEDGTEKLVKLDSKSIQSYGRKCVKMDRNLMLTVSGLVMLVFIAAVGFLPLIKMKKFLNAFLGPDKKEPAT